MAEYRAIDKCRICGNRDIVDVLHLGEQALTGVFPSSHDVDVPVGPLRLVKCHGWAGCCGLVQLAHDYDLGALYGQHYGYRSGLNASMVEHLGEKVRWLTERRPLAAGDVVLDIGSNDGTTLGHYRDDVTRIGVDPTIDKFGQHYAPGIQKVADFFSAAVFRAVAGEQRASIVTSIAMFYDLPDPMTFVHEVASVLADDGVWHLEQSYLPTMIETTSYDTVCHEHVEYYGLAQLVWMADRADLRITDVELNSVNGGSFAVTMEKAAGRPHAPVVAEQLAREAHLSSLETWTELATRVEKHKRELPALLEQLRRAGKKVYGLGASTKGNVVLQHCEIASDLILGIAEINPDKYGCFTPGTKIPILEERKVRKKKPDVFIVLPWHFRDGFVAREQALFERGGQLLFPLPAIELVSSS